MKIKPEHFEYIKAAIANLDPEKVAAHKEALKGDSRVRDLDKRFRWDCLHATVPSRWVCDNLYPYMNDDHIDTALRKIVG